MKGIAMRIASWNRCLQASCAFILMSYGIACAVAGRGQPAVALELPGHRSGSHFHTNGVFAYAIFGECVARMFCAAKSTVALHVPYLALTLPALNAAVMVGVAQVASVWAVYAVCSNTLLLLCCMWLIGDTRAANSIQIAVAVCFVCLYLAGWFLACATTEHGVSFSLVCYVISSATLALTYVTMRMLQPNQIYQDLVMAVGTVMVYIFGYALWVSVLATKPLVSAWIVFVISGALLLFLSALAVYNLPEGEARPIVRPKRAFAAENDDSDGEDGEVIDEYA